jgi:hypothetical protein
MRFLRCKHQNLQLKISMETRHFLVYFTPSDASNFLSNGDHHKSKFVDQVLLQGRSNGLSGELQFYSQRKENKNLQTYS